MGKHKDSPPPPPDPTIAIGAQTNSNINTANATAAINHNDQYTPWGSQTWTKTPGADTFDQAGYDAAVARYNAQQANTHRSGLGNLGTALFMDTTGNPVGAAMDAYGQMHSNGGGVDRAAFTTHGPDTWAQHITLAPDQQRLLDASNAESLSLANLGQSQLGNVSSALGTPLNLSSAPSLQNRVDSGNIQTGVRTNNLGGLTRNVGYGQIQNNLDTSNVPGLVGGDNLASLMHQAQQASFDQQKGYLDPQYTQQQHDLENKLTQQGIMQNSDAWNRAVDDFGRQRTQAYQNANDNSMSQGLAAEAQLYGQGLSSNQNAFGQAVGAGNFANGAQAQGFGQSMANAQLNNAANQQQFEQNLASMNAGNAAQAQIFGQGMGNAQLNNSARTQDINELMLQRENPLNELNALRTGSQVNAPQFGATPQIGVNGTDVMGQYNNLFNNQMGAYNAQQAGQNANTQTAAQLAGTAAMFFSDIRLKRNIKRVGTMHNGLPTYSYNYVGRDELHIGVMAHEVEAINPGAVIEHPSGYKMVNYGALQ